MVSTLPFRSRRRRTCSSRAANPAVHLLTNEVVRNHPRTSCWRSAPPAMIVARKKRRSSPRFPAPCWSGNRHLYPARLAVMQQAVAAANKDRRAVVAFDPVAVGVLDATARRRAANFSPQRRPRFVATRPDLALAGFAGAGRGVIDNRVGLGGCRCRAIRAVDQRHRRRHRRDRLHHRRQNDLGDAVGQLIMTRVVGTWLRPVGAGRRLHPRSAQPPQRRRRGVRRRLLRHVRPARRRDSHGPGSFRSTISTRCTQINPTISASRQRPIDLSLYLVLDPDLCGGPQAWSIRRSRRPKTCATVVQLRAPNWKKRQWLATALRTQAALAYGVR